MPSAARIPLFIRTTAGAGCSSSSWLYNGRSPICTWRKENSGGASFTMASASFRLNESFRRLPTITAIWYWLILLFSVGYGICISLPPKKGIRPSGIARLLREISPCDATPSPLARGVARPPHRGLTGHMG